MNLTINNIANQLLFVAQGHGDRYLNKELLLEEYRFKEGFELGHLWGIAFNSRKQGFYNFELEQKYIASRLPDIIEPKNFWKRNFTKWKTL